MEGRALAVPESRMRSIVAPRALACQGRRARLRAVVGGEAGGRAASRCWAAKSEDKSPLWKL
eukprot:3944111-Pleurochrysis_carterae.AAC.1